MNIEFGSLATIPVPDNLEALILCPAPPRERYSDDEFSEFCALYPDLRLEMNSEGELIIMPPMFLSNVSMLLSLNLKPEIV